MQLIYRATTATTVAAGGALTTNGVHILPSWAPPIQYIGTTDPWLCNFVISTTMLDAGVAGTKTKVLSAKVRAYGRRATLHSGAECFGTNRNIWQITGKTRPASIYILTYRAIGEISRP